MAPAFQDDGSSSVTSSPLHFFSLMSLSPSLGSSYPWLKELKSEERGLYLIHLLLSCANHVAIGSLENANLALEQISQLASPNGDTMQRIASYFTEALADRILRGWGGLHKALNSTRMSLVSEEMLVRKFFLDLFPFMKMAYVITNQAIMEAMEGEKMIHIIDLNAAEPARWIALIQALSARLEGPPYLRVTGVHQEGEVLDHMSRRLTDEAEKLDIPFQFNPVVSRLEELDVEKLRVKTGEALAVSSVLQLHTLLASEEEPRKKSPLESTNSNSFHLRRIPEKDLASRCSASLDSVSSSPPSPSTTTKIDGFINALWCLSPKLMVVTEQDSNHNGSNFMERLSEALYYYASLFDCLESSMPRTSVERLKLEKMLFGEEIKNIVACEGRERIERHEKLEKWIRRLHKAGFGNVPLSYYCKMQGRRLLQGYGCDGYRVKEENGCMVICWQDQPIFSISAWRCRK